jgi:hypothetical protein
MIVNPALKLRQEKLGMLRDQLEVFFDKHL